MSYNEWLDIEVLEDYLDGKLDAKAMHQVEKLSLEDPFVAEALAGLSQSPRRSQSLSLLQKQLQERVAQKPVEQKRWRITAQRLSIAATAAVLFVTVSLLFWMKESKRREVLAGQPKNVDVSIAPEAVKSNPEVKVTPPAEAAIDKALADSKTNTLANIKKPKAVENREVQSVVAAAPTLDRKADESSLIAKESPSAVIAAAPAQVSRALNGKVAGLAIAKNLAQVTGKVTDEGGAPIIGASVKLRGSNQVTNTNTKGEFVLNIDSNLSNQKLAIGYLGFKQREVEIKANEQVNVALQQDEHVLSEVVVTGYGEAKKKVVTPALSGSIRSTLTPNPVEGWDKFEQYLLNNNKLLNNKATTGKVVQLSFTVNAKGRPVDIKVVGTLTKLKNDEAIRLIKDGPNWVVPAKSPSQVNVNVRF
ncbi:carboxypeptidase-like regulatory domain-containing protein [Pedobacter sp. Hv1]|uniref:carboxypeptidase-like regulatory domain-containing protein n=1 Tax=Pedobacter sp. Hv1 TaxID=1740090 RepID=UPI0006D8B60D|nr:carboxypeptidase-like regulatory domain-containing protein [Pedobacter sp. Hv1]KQB99401.1 hypothetical protein AQF98_17680 [Pedobacter sp. Hv1]